MSELEQALPQTDSVAVYAQYMAAQIGEEPTTLTIIRDSASILQRMQEGVIISLHIEGTRRFWKKLTLSDLGLAIPDDPYGILSEEANTVLAQYFQLGRLSLLPSNKQLTGLPEAEREKFVSQEDFATLERSSRYCLAQFAFKSHWGWFVPAKLYSTWKKENAKCEEQFGELKARLLTNYNEIVDFVIEAYRPLAYDAWQMIQVNKSLLQQGRATITDEIIREVVSRLLAGQGKETFIANYLASIRQAIRGKQEVADSFSYAVEKSIIPLPSLLAKDLENADRLYAERAIHDAKVQAELAKITAERKLAEQQVWSKEREEREKHYLALQAERDRLERQAAMEKDVLEEAKRDKEKLVKQFYADVVGQINDQLQLVCSNVLESLNEHDGTLRGPVSQQLRTLVKQLEELNFMQDRRIEDCLAQIRDALPSEDERKDAARGIAKIDTTRLQTVVRKVAQQAKAVVIDLGMSPSQRKPRREEGMALDGLLTVENRKTRPGALLVSDMPKEKKRIRRSRAGIS